jgi:hypothetical protein
MDKANEWDHIAFVLWSFSIPCMFFKVRQDYLVKETEVAKAFSMIFCYYKSKIWLYFFFDIPVGIRSKNFLYYTIFSSLLFSDFPGDFFLNKTWEIQFFHLYPTFISPKPYKCDCNMVRGTYPVVAWFCLLVSLYLWVVTFTHVFQFCLVWWDRKATGIEVFPLSQVR